jgi:diaminohydroxyphosphoribosylaminopyrimidine deaminase/5-amino-6-(5-phosphoribosylamino)uracil reductase
MTAADDHAFMARALQLAALGIYSTDPNPSVGCVLVRDGQIVGEGFTAPAGGPHAEIVALRAAGAAAAGATAYVSLEPCSHQGRTGPCSGALIEAGVARVVCAVRDPNPLVDGGGMARLRQAGIAVESGLLEASAIEINRGYFARRQRQRPWLRLKIAASLDGRTALANGESQWITSAPARQDVHRWRARSSAVLTGSGTVLADDPALTARPEEPVGELRQPLRVIVDTKLVTPPGARTLTLPGEVVIFTADAGAAQAGALIAAGARLEQVSVAPRRERVDAEPRLDLAAVLARLAALEVNSVWVEAGPTLSGALLEAGLVDELIIYFAPQLLGDSARGMLTLTPLASLAERYELSVDDIRFVGRDLRLTARPSTVPDR